MRPIVVRADMDDSGLWSPDGEPIPTAALPLSDRLVEALADWVSFYRELGGEFEAPGVADEFVSQGYKIAHGVRRELKGSTVWLERFDTGERIPIELRRPR